VRWPASSVASIRLEGRRPKRLDLAPDQPVEQVQVGGDAAGAGVGLPVADWLARFTGELGVVATHLFD
jgi:hypothetical protein